MSALNHPDYNNELERLSYTLKYIDNYNEKVQKQKDRIDKEVEYSIKHYNSDNAEQYNELIINSTLQDSLSQKLKNLNKSLLKPYFARVDFIEDGNDQLQKLYIGKVSLLRDEDHELIIIDWRAPISTLYYEGRIGDGFYESPDGDIKGQIKLKRQYTIENAELKEIYDIDITTNDEFLQAALGSSKDKRLKDIVSTIQAEQNKVIRADMWKPLVVQGAAGGGKTTIALHRIAYLLYNYEKTLSPKNFMIIAPNRFFLSYISEVLPDLGVENVLQTTFEDFSIDIIGKKLKIKNSYEKLSFLVSNKGAKNNQIKSNSTFKSSLDFKNILDDYIRIIEKDFVPKEDYKIDGYVLIRYETINKLFNEEYIQLPLLQRINEIKKTLTNTLKQKKDSIIEEIEREYGRKIDKLKSDMKDSPDRRKVIIEIANNRDMLIEKMNKHSKTIVKEYLSKFIALTPMEYYRQLLSDKVLFNRLCCQYIDEDMAEQIRVDTLFDLNRNEVELEDLAPLMYFKSMINGVEKRLNVRHVVIDEAQDFSEFQLFVLRKLIGSDSFTILGDLCQGIYSYRGINDWKIVSDRIFGKDNYSKLTLEQSYRTTIEIMEAANSVIKFLNDTKLPPSKPVIRHGDPVKLIEKSNFNEIVDCIAEDVYKLKEENFKSAAIICKTLEECIRIKSDLKNKGLNVKIITGTENEYSGGVVIIPSYLVKGLEFDVVIISNANKEEYSTDPLDVKLLYIAMTRPLHKLCIYSIGEKAEMLSEIK